jgi:UDP-glucose 4-epimerase
MNAATPDTLGSLNNFYQGKKILVPGGAGFIGSRLSARLAGLGAAVTVVDPLDKFCGGNLFNLRSCLGNIRLVRRRIENFVKEDSLQGYALIFNCVGLSDHHLGFLRPDIDWRINCHAGIMLLQKIAQTRLSVRIISIGSRSQYGRGGLQMVESDPLRPVDIQAVHKTALESYHDIYGKAFGIDFVFFRLTNTYGPGQRMKGRGIGFVGEIIRDSLDGKRVVIYGGMDRVKALISAGMIKKDSGSIFNLGGGPHSVGKLIDSIRIKAGGIDVIVEPFPEQAGKMDTGDAVLNSERLFLATGWSPKTPLERGISDTIDYYREHKRRYW